MGEIDWVFEGKTTTNYLEIVQYIGREFIGRLFSRMDLIMLGVEDAAEEGVKGAHVYIYVGT